MATTVGSDGIVVLDLSASISSDTYAEIGTTLSTLASSGGHYGLVLFSSVAYEALPPGTPARELEPFVRFFRVHSPGPGFAPVFPVNPWTQSFSEGTAISRGLDLAHSIVVRDAPGELAGVLRALGEAGINVEDVRVEHEPGRARGVVELDVREDVAPALISCMTEAGWEVYS